MGICRRVWWHLLGGLIGAALPVGASSEDSVVLRVMSYNMHHGEGIDRRLDLHRVAAVIAAANPDVVALQEVDCHVKRTKGVDQPAVLGELTNMHVAFGANIELQGGSYGNAVLSKYAVVRHVNHRLPRIDQGEQRGVLEVEIAVPGLREPVLLFATHFDHRRDDAERLQSATTINEWVTVTSRPALLVGDLNDTVTSSTLRVLLQQWTLPHAEPLPTVPVAAPTRQIDFILYRPNKRWRAVRVQVLDEAVASDHRALVADLELLPAIDDDP